MPRCAPRAHEKNLAPAPSHTRRITTMTTLTFKATETDAHTFRAAAQEKGVSFSEYVRDTLRAATEKEPPRKFNNIITPGYVVFDGPPIDPKVLHNAIYEY